MLGGKKANKRINFFHSLFTYASVLYNKCNFYLELDMFFDRDARHDGEKEEHSKFVTTA